MKERDQHKTQIELTATKKPTLPEKEKTTYQHAFTESVFEAPYQHQRFPRFSLRPQTHPKQHIMTTTTKWWPTEEQAKHKINMQMLTITQKKQINPNGWKYSYQSTIFPFIATKQISSLKRAFE